MKGMEIFQNFIRIEYLSTELVTDLVFNHHLFHRHQRQDGMFMWKMEVKD